jgi:hypothetical protein
MMNNSFILPLKVLSLSLCLTCLPSHTQAINSKYNTDFFLQSKTAQSSKYQAFQPPIITSNQQQKNKQLQSPEVGLEVIGSSSFNGLVIPMYKYIGECPGFSKGKIQASLALRFVLCNGRGL